MQLSVEAAIWCSPAWCGLRRARGCVRRTGGQDRHGRFARLYTSTLRPRRTVCALPCVRSVHSSTQDSALDQERPPSPATCHWPGRLARRQRTGTEAGAKGRTFQQKLVSQLRGTAFGRNILVSLDVQHTHAHTTSARRIESPRTHSVALSERWNIGNTGTLQHWISSWACAPSLIQLLFPCNCCSCSTDTALASAVSQHRVLLPAQRSAPALLNTPPHPSLDGCPLPAALTALSPRTRALHPVVHLSFQQHGQRVSVALCYQT
jgi:hypothetical protein